MAYIKKRERCKDKRNRVERKREKKMVEMVDDQTVNQAANPLKKGKKNKSPILEQ
jgi:hypothetical protein